MMSVVSETHFDALAEDGVEEPVTLDEPKATASERVGLEDFGLIRVLGEGGAGKVILARKKDTAQLYALKCLDKEAVSKAKSFKYAKEEQAILKHISMDWNDTDGSIPLDPFVVKMHFSFCSDTHFFLALVSPLFHSGVSYYGY